MKWTNITFFRQTARVILYSEMPKRMKGCDLNCQIDFSNEKCFLDDEENIVIITVIQNSNADHRAIDFTSMLFGILSLFY